MSPETLPLKSKLAYGGLGAGINLTSNIAFSAITFFYTILGLAPKLIGIGWLIFAFWNAINDPLFGFIEDHTKSEKYGRRIPYIRFGAPIYAIAFILCWTPFADQNDQTALFINFIIILFVFDTIFTILGLINFTLPAEMVITAKERANLLVYSNVITSFSILVSFILPLLLLTGKKSLDSPSVFFIVMIVLAILSAIILFISSFYLKENKYTQMEDTLPVIKGIKETFKNEPFLIFEISNFSFTIAQTILTTAVYFYVNSILMLPEVLKAVPLVIVFIMIFVFLIVFSKLVAKYGVKKTFIFAMLWSGLSFFLTFFIGWTLIFAIIGFILIGIGISGYMLSNQTVIADIVDYDEIRTGKRRETTYSGINALLTKPAISIANWLFLLTIDVAGYKPEQQVQDFRAQLGIMAGFYLIPAIFLTLGALLMFFYSLDGPEWLSKKSEIIRIHQQKEIRYMKYLEEKEKNSNKTQKS
ncbi:MAG: MFS transporter [Promethearchaeota archaeon]